MRLLELLFLIFFTSYIFCLAWIVLCKSIEDFWYDVEYTDPAAAETHAENFMPYFGMIDNSDALVFLKVYYYAFTSLTTVGLGDLRPVSEIE